MHRITDTAQSILRQLKARLALSWYSILESILYLYMRSSSHVRVLPINVIHLQHIHRMMGGDTCGGWWRFRSKFRTPRSDQSCRRIELFPIEFIPIFFIWPNGRHKQHTIICVTKFDVSGQCSTLIWFYAWGHDQCLWSLMGVTPITTKCDDTNARKYIRMNQLHCSENARFNFALNLKHLLSVFIATRKTHNMRDKSL